MIINYDYLTPKYKTYLVTGVRVRAISKSRLWAKLVYQIFAKFIYLPANVSKFLPQSMEILRLNYGIYGCCLYVLIKPQSYILVDFYLLRSPPIGPIENHFVLLTIQRNIQLILNLLSDTMLQCWLSSGQNFSLEFIKKWLHRCPVIHCIQLFQQWRYCSQYHCDKLNPILRY